MIRFQKKFITNKIFSIIILLAFLAIGIITQLNTVCAENETTENTEQTPLYGGEPNIDLQVPLFSYTKATNIAEYIYQIYKAALWIIIPILIIIIILAGVLWVISGGDKNLIAKAKDRIQHGFIGLGIVLISYILFSFLGLTTLSLAGIKYIEGQDIPPLTLQNQFDLATGSGPEGSIGGKNAKEICQNIMKKPELINAYKVAEQKTGISWTIFAGIHYRERNNATSSNPMQFDRVTNKRYSSQPRCMVWPTAMECVAEFVNGFRTKDEKLIPRYYNCGPGCRLPMEYFYTHNDPDNNKIFNIKGRIDGGRYINRPDPRPGALIISNALKAGCK